MWRYQEANDRDLIKSHIVAPRHRLRDAGVREVRIENVYSISYTLSAVAPADPAAGSAPAPGSAGD